MQSLIKIVVCFLFFPSLCLAAPDKLVAKKNIGIKGGTIEIKNVLSLQFPKGSFFRPSWVKVEALWGKQADRYNFDPPAEQSITQESKQEKPTEYVVHIVVPVMPAWWPRLRLFLSPDFVCALGDQLIPNLDIYEPYISETERLLQTAPVQKCRFDPKSNTVEVPLNIFQFTQAIDFIPGVTEAVIYVGSIEKDSKPNSAFQQEVGCKLVGPNNEDFTQ